MAVLESVLLAAVLISAGAVLFCHRVRTSVAMYMLFALLLAVTWGLQYGPKLAVVELGVGVVVTGILFIVAMRKLRREKGSQDE